MQAHSLGVVTWAASSFVEALASLIVGWRFTGHRRLSATSEARAQKWVAASFFLLAPYFVIEAIRKLINGGDTDVTVLAVALTVSAIVLMPLLGWAKLRLGKTLDSGATAGEGIQNIMCAVQAATALVAVAGAGIGLSFLDPIAALAIAGIALKEGRDGWRGQDSCCTPMPGLDDRRCGQRLAGRCPARRRLDDARPARPGPQRAAGRRRPGRAYGRAYGFERAMDNLGAIGGPLIALTLVAAIGLRPAILLSIIPGLLAALAIVYAIRHAPQLTHHERQPIRLRVLRGSAFGLLAAIQSAGNLAASAIAGTLWTLVSPTAAFLYAATWMLLALAGLIATRPGRAPALTT